MHLATTGFTNSGFFPYHRLTIGLLFPYYCLAISMLPLRSIHALSTAYPAFIPTVAVLYTA